MTGRWPSGPARRRRLRDMFGPTRPFGPNRPGGQCGPVKRTRPAGPRRPAR
ncbi:hypothetical protein [Actinoplanes auranticolor]|jgi:hypothetical protein|uniref:Uncharacterized protein n=1 Tax=Actinoplanes auranticolor TaxID=47988 RepID=A0A919SRM6_9ACTN|nr:hypothetical protein [Actinoplanes auranticolor]GIM75648.1 hypothetical protein Aau02nite_66950 [Actinoplanes auranticolor]